MVMNFIKQEIANELEKRKFKRCVEAIGWNDGKRNSWFYKSLHWKEGLKWL